MAISYGPLGRRERSAQRAASCERRSRSPSPNNAVSNLPVAESGGLGGPRDESEREREREGEGRALSSLSPSPSFSLCSLLRLKNMALKVVKMGT
jgi:hypothetical protein